MTELARSSADTGEQLPCFPFPEGPDARPPAEYRALLDQPGLPEVVLSNGHSALLVSRHDEVRAVLSDDRFSRARFAGRPMFARTSESLALVTSDPPVHGHRRRAVQAAFTARAARRSVPALQALAGRLLDDLAAGPQPADLVESFAVPFALHPIADLLGIPEPDRQRLRPLVDRMMSTTRFHPDEVASAHEQAGRYFADLVRARRAAPSTDLLSELLTGPERRGVEEVAVMGAGLLMAGYETTSNQLAMCALMVFSDQDWAAHLRANPAAIGAAVDEMLRWSSLIATGGAPHVATEDIRIGDTVVRAGQVVVPLVDAANQDPSCFTAPERFQPDRASNPHLAFGHGRHFCLGAHLARTELEVGLACLLRRFERVWIAVPATELTWRRGMFIRGLCALPIRWRES